MTEDYVDHLREKVNDLETQLDRVCSFVAPQQLGKRVRVWHVYQSKCGTIARVTLAGNIYIKPDYEEEEIGPFDLYDCELLP